MTEPLLSICVPTFNRRVLLERNVNFHLRRFTALKIPFEIVIADDCSTDGTGEYLETLARNPNVQAHRRARNSGFLDNYAFVMRRARGRYAIFLGDDDLLIPEKVAEYIARLEAEPKLGMIQAPWLMMDERPGGGPMGPFYKIDREHRFAEGDLPALAGFVLNQHIFPEFMIIRREVLARSISSPCPFIFWAFLYTGRALAQADVLFIPEPFARVTAISNDPRQQQGNNETMFQWDRYRGGIEYLVSLARTVAGSAMTGQDKLSALINRFMEIRQTVALRLNIGAKNWAEAYILHHRMAAYGRSPLDQATFNQVRQSAGIATAAAEAISYSSEPAILDPALDERLLDALKPDIRARLVRNAAPGLPGKPRAFLRVDPAFPAEIGRNDAIFDIKDYVAQFV
jgi:glycosyltransferase involved in cell wall biosynthesis